MDSPTSEISPVRRITTVERAEDKDEGRIAQQSIDGAHEKGLQQAGTRKEIVEQGTQASRKEQRIMAQRGYNEHSKEVVGGSPSNSIATKHGSKMMSGKTIGHLKHSGKSHKAGVTHHHKGGYRSTK